MKDNIELALLILIVLLQLRQYLSERVGLTELIKSATAPIVSARPSGKAILIEPDTDKDIAVKELLQRNAETGTPLKDL